MAQTVTFKKGAVIFEEGTWEMYMFSIVSGKVGIYANYNATGEKLLTELGEGRLFGEMGLIEARPRSATAVALEDTSLDVIDSESLEAYFKNEPEKIVEVLAAMTKRIRELSSDYIAVCDNISGYLDAEKSKKKGFWDKIKDLMKSEFDYSEIYSDMIKEGYDPFMLHSELFWC